MASGGSEVERRVPARIDNIVSWRRGATEARRRLRAQGEGTIWRRGGINGKPSERLRFGLTPEDGFAEREREVGVTSGA
jgi:hypothetical protein